MSSAPIALRSRSLPFRNSEGLCSTHRDQLVKGHRFATQRIGEGGEDAQAQDPAGAGDVPRAFDAAAVVDPRPVEPSGHVDRRRGPGSGPESTPVSDRSARIDHRLEAHLGRGGVLPEPRRSGIVSGIDPLLDGGISTALVVAEHRPVEPRAGVETKDSADDLAVGHRALHHVASVTRAEVIGDLGADPVEEGIGTPLPMSLHRQRAVLAEPVPITEAHADPVGASVRRIGGHLVPGDEGVLPEEVRADAGAEAGVEGEGREDASLVVGAEGEEVEDARAPVVLLGRGRQATDRRPYDVFGDEVHGEQDHPGPPDQDLTGRRWRWLLPPVVRWGALLPLRKRSVQLLGVGRRRRLLQRRSGHRLQRGQQEQNPRDDAEPTDPAEPEEGCLHVREGLEQGSRQSGRARGSSRCSLRVRNPAAAAVETPTLCSSAVRNPDSSAR